MQIRFSRATYAVLPFAFPGSLTLLCLALPRSPWAILAGLALLVLSYAALWGGDRRRLALLCVASAALGLTAEYFLVASGLYGYRDTGGTPYLPVWLLPC